MRKTIEYLKAAKESLGIDSDYKMAKWLGVSAQALSRYQGEKRTIDDYAASRIAEALGIDPMEVIAAANWEREKDGKRREYWGKVFQSCAAAVLLLGISGFGINGLETAQAADNFDYAQFVKRLLARIKQGLSLRKTPRRQRHESEKDHAIRIPPAAA